MCRRLVSVFFFLPGMEEGKILRSRKLADFILACGGVGPVSLRKGLLTTRDSRLWIFARIRFNIRESLSKFGFCSALCGRKQGSGLLRNRGCFPDRRCSRRGFSVSACPQSGILRLAAIRPERRKQLCLRIVSCKTTA